MPTLSLHPDAAADLRRLMAADSVAAGRIAALLQEAKHDPKIIQSLLDHDFGHHRSAPYHVSKWKHYYSIGFNLWRLKIWADPKGSLHYRIIYAYEPKSLQYHILAIVHRNFDYDPEHEITKRILDAYAKLGITKH